MHYTPLHPKTALRRVVIAHPLPRSRNRLCRQSQNHTQEAFRPNSVVPGSKGLLEEVPQTPLISFNHKPLSDEIGSPMLYGKD